MLLFFIFMKAYYKNLYLSFLSPDNVVRRMQTTILVKVLNAKVFIFWILKLIFGIFVGLKEGIIFVSVQFINRN